MSLTPENYHSIEMEQAYWRNSQYKNWLQCGAMTKAQLEGKFQRPITEALIVGQYVDRALTVPAEFAGWCEKNKEFIFGARGGKFKPFVCADALIARVMADPIYANIIVNAESQVILTSEIGGRPWSYMADWILKRPDRAPLLLDLKTAANFDDEWAEEEIHEGDEIKSRRTRVPWYDAQGYWRQLAIGRELYRQMYGVIPVCGILGAVKPHTVLHEDGEEEMGAVGLGCWQLTNELRFEREITAIQNNLVRIGPWKDGITPPEACGSCQWCMSQSSWTEEREGWSGRMATVG